MSFHVFSPFAITNRRIKGQTDKMFANRQQDDIFLSIIAKNFNHENRIYFNDRYIIMYRLYRQGNTMFPLMVTMPAQVAKKLRSKPSEKRRRLHTPAM